METLALALSNTNDSNMAAAPAEVSPFDYDPCLQKYKVTEREYLQQNPEFQAVCTGTVVFNEKGELLLVKRASSESAFPDFWEIPGGKVDEPDESLLHAAVRELKEETGLVAARIVRQTTHMTFEIPRTQGRIERWMKLVFEMEVKQLDIDLDPKEHDDYLFATEDEIVHERIGDIVLKYISPDNKRVKLDAFKRRRGVASL
ncbi:uncharacterized protein N0V89_000965 [Didymosphaeria variabile]|uniref:Nudix hydrolase domain-containing protein n=1 Tax=Didymosphaeria variabile TaxID=1932322 RepID=A0A9W8XVN4_9PLEO|nr:uncharacterized protein N0V89_000965 [Didymosphaeria variabile]KAJ4360403.1 hypothetical protein N0V89_000965 [Didymosphaeria variabile]